MNAKRADDSVPHLASELWDLVRAYALQETVGPLKGLGKFVAIGIGGAVALATGVAVLMLGSLRVLQTHTGRVFQGNETWAPYLIVLAGGLAVMGVAAGAILSGRTKKKRRTT